MDIGKRLKQKRTSLKLTQDEVAEQLGITRQTISNWENGRSYPDIERMVHLSEIYQLSLDELLKNDQKLVTHFQKKTRINQWLKLFISLLIINMLLMLTLLTTQKLHQISFYLIFSLIGGISLTLFYLVVKNI
jgi:transcriptional regulator with XRE-family HTH domain